MYAVVTCLSVRLTVCLSQAGIVSKRPNGVAETFA